MNSVLGGLLFSLLLVSCTPSRAEEDKIDSAVISKAAGASGAMNVAAGVLKLSATRKNFDVTVAGIKLVPGLGLTARASFTGTKQHAVLIGELPLLEAEVNEFLGAALDAGLDVTAIHNAFLLDEPRIMSLHFSGAGEQEKLASAVGVLFKKFSEGAHQVKASSKVALGKTTLDPAVINKMLWKGEFVDGVYRVSTGRGTEFAGTTVGDSMGVNSWAAFAGSDERAVVTGDIAMLEYELRNVLKALIHAHIKVMSIHMHMAKEVPKIVFVHYWGVGKVIDLVKGVKAALELQKNFQGST